jgi:hypothetical protein
MFREQEIVENAWVFTSPSSARTRDTVAGRFGLSISLVLATILFTWSAWGQTSGRITGTVKDLSGAVIPNQEGQWKGIAGKRLSTGQDAERKKP